MGDGLICFSGVMVAKRNACLYSGRVPRVVLLVTLGGQHRSDECPLCARSGRTASGALRLKNGPVRDRVVALSPDQHTDDKDIENVGADADGERGRIMSETIVEQAGEPAAGGHASPAE